MEHQTDCASTIGASPPPESGSRTHRPASAPVDPPRHVQPQDARTTVFTRSPHTETGHWWPVSEGNSRNWSLACRIPAGRTAQVTDRVVRCDKVAHEWSLPRRGTAQHEHAFDQAQEPPRFRLISSAAVRHAAPGRLWRPPRLEVPLWPRRWTWTSPSYCG